MSLDLSKLQSKRKDIKILSIEGNIGSGKSTFIQKLKTICNDEIEFITEPVDEWTNTFADDVNMLEGFYKNPKNRSALFQVYVLYTRLKKMIDIIYNSNKKIFIIERTPPFADYHCFTLLNREIGNIDSYGFIVYKGLYDFVISSFECLKPDFYIYLYLSPGLCIKRIQERNRDEESKVSLEYLKGLHDRHNDWLLNLNNTITINSESNFRDDFDILWSLYMKIKGRCFASALDVL
jgi:deoxyadenosine/deoxycytidine kinase